MSTLSLRLTNATENIGKFIAMAVQVKNGSTVVSEHAAIGEIKAATGNTGSVEFANDAMGIEFASGRTCDVQALGANGSWVTIASGVNSSGDITVSNASSLQYFTALGVDEVMKPSWGTGEVSTTTTTGLVGTYSGSSLKAFFYSASTTASITYDGGSWNHSVYAGAVKRNTLNRYQINLKTTNDAVTISEFNGVAISTLPSTQYVYSPGAVSFKVKMGSQTQTVTYTVTTDSVQEVDAANYAASFRPGSDSDDPVNPNPSSGAIPVGGILVVGAIIAAVAIFFLTRGGNDAN